MNAQQIAELYQRGGKLPDAEIARLATFDHAAWTAAVDPAYRESLLPKAAAPVPAPSQPISKEDQAVTFRTLRNAVAGITTGLRKYLADPMRAELAALKKENDSLKERQANIESRVGSLFMLVADVNPQLKFPDLDSFGKRLTVLEQRPALSYVGVYDYERQYNPGNVVTKAGGMWHCNVSTRTVPGQSKDWTLCVKSGGKDGR